MTTFDIRDLRNHGDNVNVKKKSDTHCMVTNTIFFTNETKESLVSRSGAHVVGT